MKIIISPAKQMREEEDACFACRRPLLLERTQTLLAALRQLNRQELQQLWQCNDKLAAENYRRVRDMSLTQGLTPALLAYDGLQYSHMGARVLETASWEYLCRRLFILSGFYGILRADDGVTPYRLEMQARLRTEGCSNLYEFWGRSLYELLTAEDRVVLNLASKEYSRAVEPYLEADVRFVSCVFACGTPAGWRVKATEAKMARGYLVRWCAENNVCRPEEVQDFSGYGYVYRPELSDASTYVFLQEAAGTDSRAPKKKQK